MKNRILLGMGVLGFAFSLQAQEVRQTWGQVLPVENQNKFTFSNFSHLSSDRLYFRDAVAGEFSSLSVDIDQRTTSGNQRRVFSGGFIQSFSEEETVANVRDAYIQFGLGANSVSVGRKRMPWSEADELWGRGLWQARLTWDRFQSNPQGLTGLFFERNAGAWSGFALLSPLYVPEFMPPFQIEEGRFYTKNPWFRPPISGVELFKTKTTIAYDLEYPDVVDIVLRPTVALKGVYKPNERREFTVASAYKPINQIQFGAPFFVNTGLLDPWVDEVDININLHPRVVDHWVSQVEWREKRPRQEFLLSATYEKPIDNEKPNNQEWLVQESEDAVVADALLRSAINETKTQSIFIGYMQVWGGDLPVQHSLVKGNYLFDRRYEFRQAISTGLISQWSVGVKQKLSWTNKVMYDFIDHAGMFASTAEMLLSQQWILNASVHFIGLVDETGSDETETFFEKFRANDRVSVGMTYVF